jgi:hypothetical protein
LIVHSPKQLFFPENFDQQPNPKKSSYKSLISRHKFLTLILQSAVTDREDRMTVEDGLNRRDFWGTVSSFLCTLASGFLLCVLLFVTYITSLVQYWDPPVQHLWGTVRSEIHCLNYKPILCCL